MGVEDYRSLRSLGLEDWGLMEELRSFRISDIVPEDVERVMEGIRRGGFDVWLVGGALRDLLGGWTIEDWDLATDARPHEIVDLFPRVIPVGIRHGTVQVQTRKRGIEVTTCPAPGSRGILEDLARRDFTVNALALSYPEGRLLDPHAGERDLKSGILRAVGNASTRFKEDPLRTLRACRFVSAHGFRIDGNTFKAMRAEAQGLKRVAGERIRQEIFKLLPGKWVLDAFESMRCGGVLQEVLPELLEGYGVTDESCGVRDLYEHIVFTVHYCASRLRPRLAALFHNMAKAGIGKEAPAGPGFESHGGGAAPIAVQVLMRWRASHKEIRDVVALTENHLSPQIHAWTDRAVRELIVRVGPELLDDLLDLARADRLSCKASEESLGEIEALRLQIESQLTQGFPFTIRDMAVNGQDVMRLLNTVPGPHIGRILRKLHRKVIEDPKLNDRRILLDFIHKEFSGNVREG